MPVQVNQPGSKLKLSLDHGEEFKEESVLMRIEEFIEFLWNGSTKPAMHYIQECELPTILPYAENGMYESAMASIENMEEFSHHLMREIDDSANMDW